MKVWKQHNEVFNWNLFHGWNIVFIGRPWKRLVIHFAMLDNLKIGMFDDGNSIKEKTKIQFSSYSRKRMPFSSVYLSKHSMNLIVQNTSLKYIFHDLNY